MLRRSALGAGVLLTAFHLWLLANQAWDGHLADPGLIARWLASGALLTGFVAMVRRGVPVVFSRQAVAIWVLAGLMHGPALRNDADGFATPSLPEAMITLAQVAASAGALALTGLLVIRNTWALAAGAGLLTAPDHRLLPSRAVSCSIGFLPRPPPLV